METGQFSPKGLTGELAASVAVHDHVLVMECSVHTAQGIHTQVSPHVFCHGKADDLAIETVQQGCQIQLAVGAVDLGDVCQKFGSGGVAAETAL